MTKSFSKLVHHDNKHSRIGLNKPFFYEKGSSHSVKIDGKNLTIENIAAVARTKCRAVLDAQSITRIKKSRDTIEEIIKSKKIVYGSQRDLGHSKIKSFPMETWKNFKKT